ncbi:profilin [Streptomyces purpurogeneiscleroticus]|uniref:profilin n=1 Tax=Streptomyces purpurogeneiscleroticus TaxID=68259 RepID=UPI001CBA9CE3|nr:hypothetical protein [Streptomyces purpurogeneiscleroticus]
MADVREWQPARRRHDSRRHHRCRWAILASSAKSPVTAAFAKSVPDLFSDPAATQAAGVRIGNDRWLVLKSDTTSIYAKKGSDGIILVKTNQASRGGRTAGFQVCRRALELPPVRPAHGPPGRVGPRTLAATAPPTPPATGDCRRSARSTSSNRPGCCTCSAEPASPRHQPDGTSSDSRGWPTHASALGRHELS